MAEKFAEHGEDGEAARAAWHANVMQQAHRALLAQWELYRPCSGAAGAETSTPDRVVADYLHSHPEAALSLASYTATTSDLDAEARLYRLLNGLHFISALDPTSQLDPPLLSIAGECGRALSDGGLLMRSAQLCKWCGAARELAAQYPGHTLSAAVLQVLLFNKRVQRSWRRACLCQGFHSHAMRRS